MEGFWLCKGLEVVFNRIVGHSGSGMQFSLDTHITSIVLSHKNASNLRLLGQNFVPYWKSGTLSPVSLFSAFDVSKERILLFYAFLNGIHLVSELKESIMNTKIYPEEDYLILPGPCLLWTVKSSIASFCSKSRIVHAFDLKLFVKCCDFTVDKIWLPNCSYHGNSTLVYAKLIHSSRCSSVVPSSPAIPCTVSSLTIEHDHIRHVKTCLHVVGHKTLNIIPCGYSPVAMVMRQMFVHSVDEVTGYVMHKQMVVMGTETLQLVVCCGHRVADFAILEGKPLDVILGKVCVLHVSS